MRVSWNRGHQEWYKKILKRGRQETVCERGVVLLQTINRSQLDIGVSSMGGEHERERAFRSANVDNGVVWARRIGSAGSGMGACGEECARWREPEWSERAKQLSE